MQIFILPKLEMEQDRYMNNIMMNLCMEKRELMNNVLMKFGGDQR